MINYAGWASLTVLQNQLDLDEFVENDLVSGFWVQNHQIEDHRGVVHENSAPKKKNTKADCKIIRKTHSSRVPSAEDADKKFQEISYQSGMFHQPQILSYSYNPLLHSRIAAQME